jgi:flagellar motor switch protein FliM
MNDRLARRKRDLNEGFLRVNPKVDAQPAITRPHGSWQAEQPDFAGLSLYTFKPLKGTLLVSVPSEFVSRLVDVFYGGTGEAPTTQAREFTKTEDSLIGKLSDQIAACFAAVWREIATIEPQLRSRETNVAHSRIGSPDEPMVVCRFTIVPPGAKPAAIEIVFPAAALRTVEGALVAQGEEGCTRGAEWRAQLNASVGDVRVEARTVLARPELNLSELMQLKVGDVIPVSIPALVPLLVEGRTVAVGSIGEQDGKAALKIERVQTRRIAA